MLICDRCGCELMGAEHSWDVGGKTFVVCKKCTNDIREIVVAECAPKSQTKPTPPPLKMISADREPGYWLPMKANYQLAPVISWLDRLLIYAAIILALVGCFKWRLW